MSASHSRPPLRVTWMQLVDWKWPHLWSGQRWWNGLCLYYCLGSGGCWGTGAEIERGRRWEPWKFRPSRLLCCSHYRRETNKQQISSRLKNFFPPCLAGYHWDKWPYTLCGLYATTMQLTSKCTVKGTNHSLIITAGALFDHFWGGTSHTGRRMKMLERHCATS